MVSFPKLERFTKYQLLAINMHAFKMSSCTKSYEFDAFFFFFLILWDKINPNKSLKHKITMVHAFAKGNILFLTGQA